MKKLKKIMQAVYAWVSSLCMVLMLSKFLVLLLPSDEMKGYVRMVAGLVVLLLMMKPINAFHDGMKNPETWVQQANARLTKQTMKIEAEDAQNKAVTAEFKKKLGAHIAQSVKEQLKESASVTANVTLDENPKSSGFLSIRKIQINIQGLKKNKQLDKISIMDNVSLAYNVPKENILVQNNP